MSSKDNLALDLEHGVRRWDRARWISVFSSHNPTIREVTECLGLGLSASSSTTNRGIPKFDNPDYRKLSSEVTKLSKELPKERDALLDFAADPSSLNQELEDLLASYGPAIWGKDADRSCLLTPDPTKKTYNKDLFYEEPEHKDILKIHLHRWIIIKACYYIRNMKLKRPSGANEYDQLADIDGDGLSPHGTPQSLTPPDPETVASADLDVKPINLKKRKSNAHLTMSDDDDLETSPVKRPYSTMLVNWKGSPRKSLKSLYPAGPGSMENIPPMPTHIPRFSPAPGTTPEPARLQLSPLSNNDLNGVSRSPAITRSSTSSAPGGFTAVNTGSYTAVNNTSTAAPNQPTMATSKQVTSAPVIQNAPAYGIQLVPAPEAPPAPSSRQRMPSNPSQPAASPHQPVLKSQQQPQPEIAQVVPPPQTFTRGSVCTADLRLLQCEVTAGLFAFFYPCTTMPPDEPALLARIHALWFHGEALFRAELSTQFDLVSKILTAWLHERQAIASLRHSMQANPGISHVGLVDRLLAMNDLRAIRLKWKNMSSIDGMSPEDLLCMAFRAMTNTEGSEYLFKDGLARLELGVFEFLRSEDSKIVMQRRDTRAG
ncbi:uncharacterized protein ALTATR162_LOCUS2628 [Alternaria atra]|uniref:Uncharacterized protein n=1 Tax=Alternaria atra TaxID=119953 RepID=A0A8J2HVP7_9PLEO|nr:uncharacterized protein ALTATR162_LOCUS2628 [Alternaria atra]CAG5150334.1 unnamed protein product [Alternaria atra]